MTIDLSVVAHFFHEFQNSQHITRLYVIMLRDNSYYNLHESLLKDAARCVFVITQ